MGDMIPLLLVRLRPYQDRTLRYSLPPHPPKKTPALIRDHTPPPTLVSQSTLSATTRLIPVLVGGNGLEFTPNSVTAQPGDVVQFQFAASNHTATQSDAAAPCQPAASGQGVNSGFIPFDGGASGMVGTFDVPVTSTEPMFLYCAQAKHCQSGMVMVINGCVLCAPPPFLPVLPSFHLVPRIPHSNVN